MHPQMLIFYNVSALENYVNHRGFVQAHQVLPAEQIYANECARVQLYFVCM